MFKPLIILLTLVLSACATQLGVRDKVDLRRQMFSQVVFAPDYDSRRTDYLRKWTSPLSVTLKDQNGKSIEKYKPTANGQISVLENMTGLKISLATENNPANVTIHFDTLAGMQKLATSSSGNAGAAKASISNTGCHAEIDKNSDHRITAGRIFITINPNAEIVKLMNGQLNTEEDRDENLRITQCLVKGLIQILGFVNSSDVITPSIFNSAQNLSRPTSLDLKIIKALYNSSLKPGMQRKQVLQVVENLLQ
jgi:hypothetical protein